MLPTYSRARLLCRLQWIWGRLSVTTVAVALLAEWNHNVPGWHRAFRTFASFAFVRWQHRWLSRPHCVFCQQRWTRLLRARGCAWRRRVGHGEGCPYHRLCIGKVCAPHVRPMFFLIFVSKCVFLVHYTALLMNKQWAYRRKTLSNGTGKKFLIFFLLILAGVFELWVWATEAVGPCVALAPSGGDLS